MNFLPQPARSSGNTDKAIRRIGSQRAAPDVAREPDHTYHVIARQFRGPRVFEVRLDANGASNRILIRPKALRSSLADNRNWGFHIDFIDGETNVTSHGSRQMPVWGRLFRWKDGSGGARAEISALAAYLGTIQAE